MPRPRTLGVKLHYVIEKNQLTAKNEIIVDNLHVARSKAEDEVPRRIGLPLGLIVALVTDSNNGIRVNLPLTGSLQTWSADVSDAIWAAVKNVAVAERATRRMTVVRDALAEKEGIPPVRLVTGEVASATSGDGRVEFKIGQ